jgi:aryl-alcohol dehydrogenase-like predicted oxidoreductase
MIDKALSIAFDGVRVFDSVQATWNLLEPSAGPALARASAAGLDVIIKEGLANGRLTSRNESNEFTEQHNLLLQSAQELNTTVDALSLAACLAQPWATIVLSGAATVAHLQSNLRARHVQWTPEIASRLESLVESPEQYWATRSALAWN